MDSDDRNNASHESIEVVIRIKPRTDDPCDEDHRKCVFLSPSEPNTIVVETPNKKQFFSFDHIAAEDSEQQEIYDSIGQPALQEAFKGYNCCIFAYGQTGAGKTYSILGNPTALVEDYYCDSRGILPRLLEQLFILSRRPSYKSCEVRCSYLQIYNEQIIDLLNKDIRAYQIREDHKRGVYVEGMSEELITNYEDALAVILKGLKNRKIAATSMNSESSRSHTIFSVTVSVQLEENGVQKSRFSKVHIVDLAGSERTKLAKVEGDRLREGCNINKSLHALGNVINSLVESAKKKKYVPFRDSKLTYFLKDSLGGNSRTTLLANINPCRAYLGDTISTLMFAKRAKIIKVRVEANQNIADNFESLRNEIRKLREQLAQTKFIKNDPKPAELDETMRQRFVDLSVTELDQTQERVFKVFQENEYHFRTLTGLYKQRLANYSGQQRSDHGFKNMFEEKKILQKSCASYEVLVANFPAFTRIFRENVDLKRKLKAEEASHAELIHKSAEVQLEVESLRHNNRFLKGELAEVNSENSNLRQNMQELMQTMNSTKYSIIHGKKDGSHTHLALPGEPMSATLHLPKIELGMRQHHSPNEKGALTRRDELREIVNRQNCMLQQYETAIEELKERLAEQVGELRESYHQLQKDLEMERQYKQSLKRQTTNKRKDIPAQLETLENENEYLKLNVMELETELSRVEQENFKKEIEMRTVQEEADKLRRAMEKMEKINEQNGLKEKELLEFFQKVRQVQEAALREQKQIEDERDALQEKFRELQSALLSKLKENYQLASKNESLATGNAALKKKLTEILKVESQQSVIMNKESACWTTLEEDNISEDFTLEKTMNGDLVKELDRVTLERDSLLNRLEEEQHKLQEQHTKLEKASNKILSLTRDLTKTKEDNRHETEELRRLQVRVEEFEIAQRSTRQRAKLLECDYNKVRRQNQQTDLFLHKIRDQLGKQLAEVVEEYKTLKIRNQVLNQENERLRGCPQADTKITGQSANTKSMRYLPVVKESDLTTPRLNSTQKMEDLKQFFGSTSTVIKAPEPRRRESFGTPTPVMLKKMVELKPQPAATLRAKQKQPPPRK